MYRHRVNLNLNRTDAYAGLCHVGQVTDPILCRLGFNFDGAAGLLQYPAYHRPILLTPLA